MTDDGLMRELEEDIKRDAMAKRLKQWGPVAGVLVVLVVASVGGVQFWKHWQKTEQERIALAYQEAIGKVAAGGDAEALKHFADGEGAGGAYAALAGLKQAGKLMAEEHHADAAKTYADVAAKAPQDSVLAEWALLQAAYHSLGLEDKNVADAQAEAVKVRLGGGQAIMPGLLKEWLALWNLEKGNAEESVALLRQVEDDATAPQTTRQRAREMGLYLSSMGSVKPAKDASAKVDAKPADAHVAEAEPKTVTPAAEGEKPAASSDAGSDAGPDVGNESE